MAGLTSDEMATIPRNRLNYRSKVACHTTHYDCRSASVRQVSEKEGSVKLAFSIGLPRNFC